MEKADIQCHTNHWYFVIPVQEHTKRDMYQDNVNYYYLAQTQHRRWMSCLWMFMSTRASLSHAILSQNETEQKKHYLLPSPLPSWTLWESVNLEWVAATYHSFNLEQACNYVSPSVHRGGDMLVYLCPLSESVLSVWLCSGFYLQAGEARLPQQTRDVDPMLG